MDKQLGYSNPWEAGLLTVARRQLQYLRELNADQSGEVGAFDISSALSGLCALIDLPHEADFDFSEPARAALMDVNEAAMALMRDHASRPLDEDRDLGNPDQEAAVALYNAILSNLPKLATGDSSGHALVLSKEMYQNLVERCGDRPGFDVASSVIRVQAYRAIQLAARLTIKL